MKLKNLFLCSLLCLFSPLSWSVIQYKPMASIERHDLSVGFVLDKRLLFDDQQINFDDQQINIAFPVFFLNYSLYVPEILQFFPSSYFKYLVPSLAFGINLFQKKVSKRYGICNQNQSVNSSNYQIGLKAKIPFFENFQPFGEFGLAKSFCYAKNFTKISKPQLNFTHYYSYGLILSLKILDKETVYTLDQIYGINDVAIKVQCLHYYIEKNNKNLNFCQAGLQVTF